MILTVREVQAKTIISKTGIPGTDWVVNPYMGCSYGCKYCYAYFVGRFRHPDEEWGSYVDVKVNTKELFTKELKHKLQKAKSKDIGSIWFSSVTDPYQGLEAKYKMTRGCLEELVKVGYEGRISILTKSHLVTRDIDLFKQLKQVEVGVTVTSMGDPITEYLETFAPPHQERIKALKKLHQAGVPTYAFVGPLLPHLAKDKAKLWDLLNSLKQAGVAYIFIEHLNLKPYIADRLLTYIKKDRPGLINDFEAARSPEYRAALGAMVMAMTKKLNLKVAGNQPIHHPESGGWTK